MLVGQNSVFLFVLVLLQNVVLLFVLLLMHNLAHSQSDLGQKTFEVRQFLCLEFYLGRPWAGGWLGVGWLGCGAGSGPGGGGGGGGVDGVWALTVNAKVVECFGKTPFGKAISLIVFRCDLCVGCLYEILYLTGAV